MQQEERSHWSSGSAPTSAGYRPTNAAKPNWNAYSHHNQQVLQLLGVLALMYGLPSAFIIVLGALNWLVMDETRREPATANVTTEASPPPDAAPSAVAAGPSPIAPSPMAPLSPRPPRARLRARLSIESHPEPGSADDLLALAEGDLPGGDLPGGSRPLPSGATLERHPEPLQDAPVRTLAEAVRCGRQAARARQHGGAREARPAVSGEGAEAVDGESQLGPREEGHVDPRPEAAPLVAEAARLVVESASLVAELELPDGRVRARGVVRATRAQLYLRPEADDWIDAYAEAGATLELRERRGDFVRVVVTSARGPTKGWLRASDVRVTGLERGL